MKPIWLVAGIVLLLTGCGAKQNLISLQISPPAVALRGVQSQVQLRVSGIYTNPYAVRDLTTQVTWASDSQRIADFVAVCSDTHDVCQQSLLGIAPATCAAPATCILVPGLLTAGSSCAPTIQVSASVNRPNNAVLVGNASVDVTQPICP